LSQLLFPPKCGGCLRPLKRHERALCFFCLQNLPIILNRKGPQLVDRSLTGRVPGIRGFAFLQFRNGATVQRMLHQFKYHGQVEVGRALGNEFGKHLIPHFSNENVLLVPVPLHKRKLKVRGFNQCDAICEGLIEQLTGKIGHGLLERVKFKKSLTKLNRVERAEATAELYKATRAPDFGMENIPVLVVDDVITTGATMVACCEALYLVGWKNVVALALCYADS
jgi:ComF family protein